MVWTSYGLLSCKALWLQNYSCLTRVFKNVLFWQALALVFKLYIWVKRLQLLSVVPWEWEPLFPSLSESWLDKRFASSNAESIWFFLNINEKYKPSLFFQRLNIITFSQRAFGQTRALAHTALDHSHPSAPAACHPALVPREPALSAHRQKRCWGMQER